jgi:general secretion pathway protein A
MINVIADRALLGAYTLEEREVTPELIREAVSEVYDRPPVGFSWWNRPWWAHPAGLAGLGAAGLLIVLASGFAGLQWLRLNREPPVVGPAPAAMAGPANPVAPLAAPDSGVPIVPLETLLKASADSTGTDTAFSTLFRLWTVDLKSDAKRPCVQAEEGGLHCLYQRGTLDQLRTLGLPAILTLRDGNSDPHQVVLAGLGPEAAVVNIGGTEFRVANSELERLWFGESLLLWRPGTSVVKSFLPGMRDPDVRWLRASLARIQGKPADPMESDLYDEALAGRVRDYQRDRHLPVDGMAGYATQVAINSDLGDADMPRLAQAN